MSSPEARLAQRRRWCVTLARRRATSPARISHHAAEPPKTPTTRSRPLAPMPAKMAAKDMIVIGLLRVRASVEEYAPARRRPLVALSAVLFAGWDRRVRTPR